MERRGHHGEVAITAALEILASLLAVSAVELGAPWLPRLDPGARRRPLVRS